jgi:hypothetical protein
VADPKPVAFEIPREDPILRVPTTPGWIEYVYGSGPKRTLYFQANPQQFTRSRTIQRIDSRAGNGVQGSPVEREAPGRKFTLRAEPWKIENLELSFDISRPFFTSPTYRAEQLSHKVQVERMQEVIDHLERIAEPGPVRTRNEAQTGFPPAPSPPLLTLRLGKRSWDGYVKSVTILEKDFTHDLYPKQLKVTLGFEPYPPYADLELGKTGGKR